jgi:hypothetical protein
MPLEEAAVAGSDGCVVHDAGLRRTYIFLGDGTIHVVLDIDGRVCEKELSVRSWRDRLKYRLPF